MSVFERETGRMDGYKVIEYKYINRLACVCVWRVEGMVVDVIIKHRV